MQFISASEKDTYKFAEKIAKSLKGGEVIGLIGNLGAGKTTFTKGLAKALGIRKNITSPTFVLMKIYKLGSRAAKFKNLVHIDAYRLKSATDLTAIGAKEYFKRKDTVVLIEWADRIKKTLPLKTIYIKIAISGTNKRTIKKGD